MHKYHLISVILLFLLFTSVSLKCTNYERLKGMEDDMTVCEEMLYRTINCSDKTSYEVVTKVTKGLVPLVGELSYEADLTTECITSPMRLNRNVIHSIRNVNRPSLIKDLPVMEKSNVIYPIEECSWNWVSQSVIETSRKVLIRSLEKGLLSPFQNIIRVDGELCKIDQASDMEASKKLLASCGKKDWISEKNMDQIEHDVLTSRSMTLCVHDGKLIEYDTGIVLGENSLCSIVIASENYILTSDHLLIKPHDKWSFEALDDCKSNSDIFTLKESTVIMEIEEQERKRNRDGPLICESLVVCGKKCNSTKLISMINSLERTKPGKFIQIRQTSLDNYEYQFCFHDDLNNREDIKLLNVTRDQVKSATIHMLISSNRANLDSFEGEIKITDIIPTLIKDNSLHITTTVLILIALVIIIKLLNRLICRRKNRRTSKGVEQVFTLKEL